MMLHLWITFPIGEHFVPGAMVAVPERQCLTYAAELIPHLRVGVEVKLCNIDPATGNPMYEWSFKCT